MGMNWNMPSSERAKRYTEFVNDPTRLELQEKIIQLENCRPVIYDRKSSLPIKDPKFESAMKNLYDEHNSYVRASYGDLFIDEPSNLRPAIGKTQITD